MLRDTTTAVIIGIIFGFLLAIPFQMNITDPIGPTVISPWTCARGAHLEKETHDALTSPDTLSISVYWKCVDEKGAVYVSTAATVKLFAFYASAFAAAGIVVAAFRNRRAQD